MEYGILAMSRKPITCISTIIGIEMDKETMYVAHLTLQVDEILDLGSNVSNPREYSGEYSGESMYNTHSLNLGKTLHSGIMTNEPWHPFRKNVGSGNFLGKRRIQSASLSARFGSKW